MGSAGVIELTELSVRESDQMKCMLGAPGILLFYHSHREMTFHTYMLIIVFIIGP